MSEPQRTGTVEMGVVSTSGQKQWHVHQVLVPYDGKASAACLNSLRKWCDAGWEPCGMVLLPSPVPEYQYVIALHFRHRCLGPQCFLCARDRLGAQVKPK